MADRVGQQLGNYRLVALLGQGSYAQVYLGQHVRFKQQAAIKMLHAHLSGVEAEHFQQEAETIATLAHPGIIRVLDFDIQEGVPFLVMDYAPNGSLRQCYPKGSLVSLPVIVSVVKQVAEALQYAHKQKVIHRDVKPENMLLGRREEVVLSDFGIATIAHGTSSLSTSEEGTSGTLVYMAPEQIEGHPRPASDQYALGVVVYEWLCGERPFEGSVSELIAQHLSMPPPALRERVPAILAEVEQVVLRSLAKDPKQRFASVQDFALALQVASTAASPGSTLPMLASAYAEAQHTTKHNLPAYLTSLLGREQEVVEACTILQRPDVRLVTLTGPGGIGKTRLAVHLATELLADFAGGVYFVSLAPTSDSELVIPAIAQTLEVKESGALSLMDLLKAFLKDKHVLLVLDNFEQLLPAAPQLADLLTSCPHLNILVTSRAALHLQGEHEFLVPPLAVPDLTHLPEQEVLSQYAAVALFLQRAQAINPAFQLTSSNARPIAEICACLDGLPLAIELAAARVKLFPPQTLLTRLEHGLAILSGGARDLPVRQQTLRGAIAWSYNLLYPDEQTLFRRLSVFVDGCSWEAVELVCTAAGRLSGDILGGLSSLLDKSLLRQQESTEGEPRFWMLQTLREFGLEMLTSAGEAEVTRQAHAEYYLALAEEADPQLKGHEQARWFAQLDREYENLRVALSFLLEGARAQVGIQEGQSQAERALRLCAALYGFWYNRGYEPEGLTFLEQALVQRNAVGAALQAKALSMAGELAYVMEDVKRAENLCEEGLVLYREMGDKTGIADLLLLLGSVARFRCQYALARVRLEEAASLFLEVSDRWKQGQCYTELARMATEQGQYERARELLEEGLKLYQALGDQQRLGWIRYLQARLLFFSLQDLTRAQRLAEQSLTYMKELGDMWCASPLKLLGQLCMAQGDLMVARTLLEESLAITKATGLKGGEAVEPLISLAYLSALQGNLAAARRLYQESLALLSSAFSKEFIAASLEGLGAVEVGQGEPLKAARLWGTAEALRETIGAPLYPVYRADYNKAVATARAELSDEAFAMAWSEGRTTPLEQVIDDVLRTVD